jgi:hypothetical protein
VRVKDALKQKIVALADKKEVDSPVYLFLPTLTRAVVATAKAIAAGVAPAPSSAPTDERSFAELMDSFRHAKESSDWLMAIAFLNRLRTMQPQDPYILQQLALATYKSELPDKLAAFNAAKKILEELSPATSADAETVGLWGAVHKRMWEIGRDRADLEDAISAYERGFFIKNDYYNGINYAYMLDVRASESGGDEALTDRLLARRIRARVLEICENKLNAAGVPDSGIPTAVGAPDDAFWIGATKVEALFGLGRLDEAELAKAAIIADETGRLHALGLDPAKEIGWRVKTLNQQLDKLQPLSSSDSDGDHTIFIRSTGPPPAHDQVLILVDSLLHERLNRQEFRPFPLDIFTRVVRSLIKVRQTFGALAAAMMKAVCNEPRLLGLAGRAERMGRHDRLAARVQHSVDLFQPRELHCLGEVGEDRDRVDEVEETVGVRQGRHRLVDGESRPPAQERPAPLDRLCVDVRPMPFDGQRRRRRLKRQFLQRFQHPGASNAEIEHAKLWPRGLNPAKIADHV